jgi:Fe-S cluster assembly protein SufD
VNGRPEPILSDTKALATGTSFTDICEGHGETARHFGRLAQVEESDAFACINTALFESCATIYVPAGLEVKTPLHVVFHSTGTDQGDLPIICPRILVVLGNGARAHLVEEYRGAGRYLTCPVVEIALGEGSWLRHDRIQFESPGSFHFCSLWAELEKGACYGSTLISNGAAISRQNPKAVFLGEGAEIEQNGLSYVHSGQASDLHSLIDHAAPTCTSRQLQKFIVSGSGRGIFNGRIIVRQGAQGTEAAQSSRNVLLDDSARMDAKPQLEIHADDVKCSHGAAVGQLDAEGLFYLQSRGLDQNSARRLLLTGFAADVMNRLSLPSLRSGLLNSVMEQGATAPTPA